MKNKEKEEERKMLNYMTKDAHTKTLNSLLFSMFS